MAVETYSIQIETQGDADIQDITEAVGAVLYESEFSNGVMTIFCPSSTSALTTIEYESGCISDLRRLFDELVDPDRHYAHNAAALLGPSFTVPFVQNRLTLGTWQQIIYIDFDNRPRRRELVVQIIGE